MLLLDSHVLLWLLEDSDRLGAEARAAIDSSSRVFFSAASIWELEIKRSLGRLQYPDGLVQALESAGLTELPISARHASSVEEVDLPHRDPFDRLLVAQARAESARFLTADGVLLGRLADVAVDATR